MDSLSPASTPRSANPAVGAACGHGDAARRARLLGLIVHMEDMTTGLMEAFAAQAHAEMAAAQAARDVAGIGEFVPQGAGVKSGMAFDRMARVLRLAIMLEERVAEGTAAVTAPVRSLPAIRPAVTREVADRLDEIDAPEQLEANERMDRLENEVLRGDRPIESYLAEMFGEMEREMRASGLSDPQIEAELETMRRQLAAMGPAEDEPGAVYGEPDREDAAPEGADVFEPPNRGPP